MSCNITAGIAKGCNDQVGGIAGVHYVERIPGVTPLLDANGVVIDYQNDSYWYWVDAENQQGNVTETYEFGSGASVLGFNQKATFFIPDTAEPSTTVSSHTVNNFAGMIAQQNNMAIMIETGHNTAMRGPWPKCYLFGHERGAYCSGGNKQSGVNYTDNNGYTIDISANSKEPMLEMSYLSVHLPAFVDTNQNALLGGRYNGVFPTSWTVWDYTPLKRYIGGNVRYVIPPLPGPEIYVQAGDMISFKAQVTAEWNANAFDSNGNFAIGAWSRLTKPSGDNYFQYAISNAPTAPGLHTIQLELQSLGAISTATPDEEVLWSPLLFVNTDPANQGQYIIFTDNTAGIDASAKIEIMAVTQS